MERTLSVNYPELRQNKRVLLNTFVKNHCLKSRQRTLIREARRDRLMECTQRNLRDKWVFYERIQQYMLILP